MPRVLVLIKDLLCNDKIALIFCSGDPNVFFKPKGSRGHVTLVNKSQSSYVIE